MLIEFFGLAGTGKSTMSRRVADLLLRRGLVVDEVTYDLDHRRRSLERLRGKFGYLVCYAAAHPRHAFFDLFRVARTRQATLTDLGKSIFNWMFIASLASRKRSRNGITLLDQGVAQAMWSIGFAAQHDNFPDLLADTARAALRPDLIIHVRANFQTIGERLATRERRISRMDALGRDHQALQRAETHSATIIHGLASSGVPVIEVENNDPRQLVSGAQFVAGAILTMVSEQRIASSPLVKHAEHNLTDDRPMKGLSPSRAERKETSWQTN